MKQIKEKDEEKRSRIRELEEELKNMREKKNVLKVRLRALEKGMDNERCCFERELIELQATQEALMKRSDELEGRRSGGGEGGIPGAQQTAEELRSELRRGLSRERLA